MHRTVDRIGAVISNFIFCFNLLYRSSKKTVYILLLMNLIKSALPFINLYLCKYLIDALLLSLSTGNRTGQVSSLIILMLTAWGICKTVAAFLESFIQKLNDLQIQYLLTYINFELINKTVTIDISYFDIPKNYDDLSRSRQNAHSLHQIVFATANTISGLFFFIINAVLALQVNWIMSLAVIIFELPKFISRYHAEKESYEFDKKQFRKTRFSNYLYTLLFDKPAAKEIRLFNIGDYLINMYVETQNELARDQDRLSNRFRIKDNMAGIPSILLQIFIKVYVAYRILQRSYSLGDFTYISGIYENLSAGTLSIINAVSTFVGFNERISDFKHYFMYRNSLVKSGGRKLKSIESITFKDVSFSYPGSEAVLMRVSFEIMKNEKCMLVGLNGSGKTTIIKLITRFYEPTEGSIYINRIPVEEYDLDDLRSHIAAVFQDFNIFSFTIRENVAIGDLSKMDDDHAIKHALNFSHFNNEAYRKNENVDLFINKNFETDGIELSGGQRQKLAVSRAAIRDADMIILDEPTASMDPMSESEILDAFSRMYRNKTLLMVSHRLSAAVKMDRIIFIERGRVSGIGTHKILYADNQKYRRLYNLQANKYR